MASILHRIFFFVFFFNDTATTEIYTLSLHDALPICKPILWRRLPTRQPWPFAWLPRHREEPPGTSPRSPPRLHSDKMRPLVDRPNLPAGLRESPLFA